MIVSRLGRVAGGILLTAIVLAGCAGKPKPVPPTPVAASPAPTAPLKYTATVGLDVHARSEKILELLNAGDPEKARIEAEQLMREQPDSALARSAIEQIDNDPKALLGEQSFAYEIKPGETLQGLAERFLNDRNKFYALAKLNGIAVPSAAAAGQTIQIPGRKPAPPKPREIAEPPRKAAPPPLPAPRPTDPRRATALRSQALVQMNKGKIDQAVSLLRAANQADPTNTAVSGDLSRALRIQAATHH